MAIYPGATWRPLPENDTQREITATQLILHSAVSRRSSLFDFFNSPGVNVESHFYVPQDGSCEQYVDTGRLADANYKANSRAISVETWDNANPDSEPWSEAQVVRLVDLAVWAHRTHGIPLVWCASPEGEGIGYHSLFRDWSPVIKTCPGLARRPQVQQVIDRAVALVREEVTPAPPEPGPVSPAPERQPGVLAPPFPLPRGWYFGPRSGPRHCVSGYHSHRESLAFWQRRMGKRGWKITADGLYGPKTAQVTKAFQRNKGLVADGLIGPATWSAAWTMPL